MPWNAITSWIAIIMVVDGGFALALESSILRLVPGLPVRTVAAVEVSIGLIILGLKAVVGRGIF